MQSLSGMLRNNLPYLFVVVGAVWLGFVVVTGSTLLLWPVLACVISGVLLRIAPLSNFTAAWVGASALMGLVLSVYQAYVATALVTGRLAEIAWISLAAFVIFGVVHLYLLAASRSAK